MPTADPRYTRALAPEITMHVPSQRFPSTAALAGIALAALLLASCGRQANPSPTNTALNVPEGTAERAPARPDELKPPALPPQPGHIGRTH